MSDCVYDIIGVGIGPFNLGLAALLEPVAEINALFLEQKPQFHWHPGLLMEGTTIQVPFLADLVTMADPSSRFSFLSYLQAKSRLYHFYFWEQFHIPRREYNHYCQWVAQQLPSCRFGQRVETISQQENSHCFEVQTRDMASGTISTYRCRNLVLGVGSVPRVPGCLQDWQANFMRYQPAVQQLLNQGLLQDLGVQGRSYLPTSSIRTVYHPEATFMLKLSLNVKITNSMRTNLYKELERSVEVYQLLAGEIGKELGDRFPNFSIIRDPAFITLKIDGEPVEGFATILRENPFLANPNTDATCLIALCQDAISSDGSRLSQIIHQLAQQEGRSTGEVSLDWFRRYLKISLEPILWLYFTYGIAIEAHQQNSVLQLQDGYPDRFFYRDNQGYYYRRSFSQQLDALLPGISQKSQTFCDDVVIDERIGYYLFINNLFGLINAFGVAGLVDEQLLLAELRTALANQSTLIQGGSTLLQNLLCQSHLRCKANLLTRFHDMDELVGAVSTQSVYVAIDNPLLDGGIYVP